MTAAKKISSEKLHVTGQDAAPHVAVLIPCYNEAATIAKVVEEFRAALPEATVYVYDNNSTDDTVANARAAGASIGYETRQGKGHVIKRMFSDIEADIYVLVDGDATYDAASVQSLIARLLADCRDMVVGARVDRESSAFRRGHRLGNRMLTAFVATVFGTSELRDMLSGYRVLSRRFVKSLPVLSTGFEIETELTIHAMELDLPIAEVDTAYFARPVGSESKLDTWYDGFRILHTILRLYRAERPLLFFSIFGLVCATASLVLAIPIVITYVQVGLVPRLPTAVLSTGLMLTAFLAIACGFILDTVTRGRKEMKRLAYLAHRAPRFTPNEAQASRHGAAKPPAGDQVTVG
jgi:glycosyltransferase involved in cell wall biosynthesis